MHTLRLSTFVDAPLQRCFLLALSVDLQKAAAAGMKESITGGTTSGLLLPGQTVTWSTRRLRLDLTYTVRLESCRPYVYLHERMTEGSFERFEHERHFVPMDGGTRMRDEIRFSLPFGRWGRVLQRPVADHLKTFFAARNARIRQAAESEEWHSYLDGQTPVDPSRVVRVPEPAVH